MEDRIRIIYVCGVIKDANHVISRYVQNEYNDSNTHSVCGVSKIVRLGSISKNVWFHCSDFQERYDCFPMKNKLEGIVYIFSIHNKSTFEYIQTVFKTTYFPELNHKRLLIGDYYDDNLPRRVSREEAEAFAKKYNMPYAEMSSFQNKNVNEPFYRLILDCHEAMEMKKQSRHLINKPNPLNNKCLIF